MCFWSRTLKIYKSLSSTKYFGYPYFLLPYCDKTPEGLSIKRSRYACIETDSQWNSISRIIIARNIIIKYYVAGYIKYKSLQSIFMFIHHRHIHFKTCRKNISYATELRYLQMFFFLSQWRMSILFSVPVTYTMAIRKNYFTALLSRAYKRARTLIAEHLWVCLRPITCSFMFYFIFIYFYSENRNRN